ncbi:hypothetical protein [Streptomyces sp. NPDC054958]
MSTSPKSHVPHGEGPSRHEGTEQHGWSPDVDSTHTQDNPSAKRSFHPEEHAPKSSKDSRASTSPGKADEGVPVESRGRRGEDQSKGRGQKGHHDMGTRGKSQRPSGGRDATAVTGVDPKDADGKPHRG